ncbi:U3 small nucleolar RNA-associated protein 23 [Pancytospora philotis]|nr:U3 small nucleolar RNA-associated protein 23 [Pancytospora philotis]
MVDAYLKKNKKIVKTLQSHGFRKPYQVLVDCAFVRLMNKLPSPLAAIQNTLKGETKLFIPKCEFDKHKPRAEGKDASGQCEIIKCTHEPDVSCFEALLKELNEHHFLLGTDDPLLVKKYSGAEAVPLMRIKNCRVVVEVGPMQRVVKSCTGAPAGNKELERLRKMFEE